jgi:DNA polymerase-3 subunit gamma/tau
VPDAATTGLIDAPADRLESMGKQASAFGRPRLTRAAEIISAGLVDMRGATSARLLLELMCAQVLLPAADEDPAGLSGRLERLEQLFSRQEHADQQPGSVLAVDREPRRPAARPEPGPTRPEPGPTRQPAPEQQRPAEPGRPEQRPDPAGLGSAGHGSTRPVAAVADAASLRARWADVLEAVQSRKRVASMQLTNARVSSFADGVLTLAFAQAGTAKGFLVAENDKILAEVLADMFGIRPRIATAIGTGDVPSAGRGHPGAPASATARDARPGGAAEPQAQPKAGRNRTDAGHELDVGDRLDADSLTGSDLVQRELGGRLIEELDES